MYFLNFVENEDNIILKCLNYDNNGVKKKKNKLVNNKYNVKLLNNITRAKSKILDYAYNNDFKFFITATISSEFDRTDLKKFISRFTQYIRDLRKKYNDSFFYLIVPELHKDNKSWHLHGLVGGGCVSKDMYINKYGYFSLHFLDKLGFNSLSVIQNKEACNIYITKYITKSICSSRNKGEFIFYSSKGLKTGFHYKPIKISEDLINDDLFDFVNERIKVKKYFNKDIIKILQEYYILKNKYNLIDNLKKLS